MNGRSEYGLAAIRGAIFDLDGVLVDTAKYHYLAWKRLAGELHIDFTSEDNERLKGVSRVRSLEIILELGARPSPKKTRPRPPRRRTAGISSTSGTSRRKSSSRRWSPS